MKLLEKLGRNYEIDGVAYSVSSAMGLYECPSCLKTSVIRIKSIKSRKSDLCRKCGHAKNKLPDLHIKIRRVLYDMKRRTTDSSRPDWVHYADINVCDDWLNDYGAFTKWSLENGYAPGKQIDRIDPKKDYSPDNCRWVDKYVQGQNKRLINASNTLGYRGVAVTHSDKFSAHITVCKHRLNLGTFDTALEAALVYDNFILRHPECEHPTNFDNNEGESYAPKKQ